jgi:hypothetical protein
MAIQTYTYCSPKLEGREMPDKGFSGLFAREPIAAGELLAFFTGKLIDGEQLEALPPADQVHILQVDENLYLEPFKSEDTHLFNHSCEPNAWFEGAVTVVARWDIAVGEEVCFDYAMCDGSPYDEFQCLCGSDLCRKTVTGDDWKNPALWERYAGHFSPYLARRIAKLK